MAIYVIDYKIVRGLVNDLNRDVMELIRQGYQLNGCPFSGGDGYLFQSMVKYGID
jgi:hypothetical protein